MSNLLYNFKLLITLIFKLSLAIIRRQKLPPLFIPSNLLKNYTMDGKVKLQYMYFVDSYPSTKPIIYTKDQINSFMEKAKKKETFYYGDTDLWLYQALEAYSIRGKDIAIIGSVIPLYESICLSYEGRPTTIEYNKIKTEDPRIKAMTNEQYKRNPVKFDAAFSISSFEHMGLGRYGDPLDPLGDLKSMQETKSIVKRDGILFLSVPIGMDTVVWNAHRIYGRVRLPQLLEGWDILQTFGFNEGLFDKPHSYVQPIFVLKNR